MMKNGYKHVSFFRFQKCENLHVKSVDELAYNGERSILTHQVEIFCKNGKEDKWYLKIYDSFENLNGTLQSYEREAVTGDLYRFILGKQRAAKTRVTKDSNDKIHGVFSQHNPAGFKCTYDCIRSGMPEIRNREDGVLNPSLAQREYGVCELTLAEMVLGDPDGNPANVGLNNHNQLSRIDYDSGFYSSGEQFLFGVSIGRDNKWSEWQLRKLTQLFGKMEALLISDKNEVSLNRFYLTVLKICLINDVVFTSICKRHFEDITDIEDIKETYLDHRDAMINLSSRSTGFNKFMENLEETALFAFLEDYFKPELKNDRESYEACMSTITQSITKMKSEKCINGSLQPATSQLNEGYRDFKQGIF